MSESILTQARVDGYHRGREDEKAFQAQLSMCRYDDAREDGRREARNEAAAEKQWLRVFWFAAGALIAALIARLVP